MKQTTTQVLVALLLALTTVAGGFLAPTAAQAAPAGCKYPAAACACPTLSVSTTVPQPGESFEVAGTNFAAGARETLVLKPADDTGSGRSYVIGRVRASSTGSFRTTATMPRQANGRFDVVARGPRAGAADIGCPADPASRVDVTVLAENNNPDSGGNETGTAFTGFNLLWWLLLAAALVSIGVYANRRGHKGELVRSIHG